jgi:hypothetical protein
LLLLAVIEQPNWIEISTFGLIGHLQVFSEALSVVEVTQDSKGHGENEKDKGGDGYCSKEAPQFEDGPVSITTKHDARDGEQAC